jgi:putative flavoprotein involved in K+ transport
VTIIDTVVIGAGHAGLAVSRLLTVAGREHVVLDRGAVGERWRSERWDSLHLLSPNWMSRLPGWRYTGPDQEGFMSAAAFVDYLERYAASFDAPVQQGTTVLDVSARHGGYLVATDTGTWRAANVVIATGAWGAPVVPAGSGLAGVEVIASNAYRNPAQLPGGGTLVVGASSSGVQIADELARSGRRVVLAVGRHTRMPRRYRGMDTHWWLERTGRLARTIDEVPDAAAARREPSMQLVGRSDADRYAPDLDLASLQASGVQLVGRLQRADARGHVRFGKGLRGHVRESDDALSRFLDRVDKHVDDTGLARELWPGMRPRPVAVPDDVPTRLDLRAEGISSVVLAAGFRPHHPWLRVPVVGPGGQIRQYRGVTPAPGLYVVGQRFQHRRDSATIDGARFDARDVLRHLCTGSTANERDREPRLRSH